MAQRPSYLEGFQKGFINGRVVWYNKKTGIHGRYHTWNAAKAELDIYNIYGEYLGTINSVGEKVKNADRRRHLDVENIC